MTAYLYQLKLYDAELSDEEHTEAFLIGLFSTSAQAAHTAERYLREVPGFRSHPCGCRITPKQIIGFEPSLRQVYIVEGWNVNDAGDEVDPIESDCFTEKSEAEQALACMRRHISRSSWVVCPYTIDECLWQEGFVRL